MSDESYVSADDLAGALREAIIATRAAFGVFLAQPDEKSRVDRWESLLHRYEDQRRSDLTKYADECAETRKSTMKRAKWARDQGRRSDVRHLVRRAHDYNQRCVRLRRDIRKIEGYRI